MSKATVLFFAADPLSAPSSGGPRLQLDEDVRRIREKVRAAEYRDDLVFDLRLAARADDLIQGLNETFPRVVHFSGHGSSEGLMLVGRDGGAHLVSPAALEDLFRVFRGDIRVVVLNACLSLPQAQAIAAVVGCAIGTRKKISDDAAITFGASFYRALAFGRSVQTAFDQARVALTLEHPDEEETPQIIANPEVDPTRLYVVGGEDRGGPTNAGDPSATGQDRSDLQRAMLERRVVLPAEERATAAGGGNAGRPRIAGDQYQPKLEPALADSATSLWERLSGWVMGWFLTRPDLVVSSLEAGGRLQTLPGHPLLRHPQNQATVFGGGFRARISLTHNHQGAVPIKVRGVTVAVDEFVPGERTELCYRIDLDQLIGRHVAEVHVFHVTLWGAATVLPVWIGANRAPLRAATGNLLDIMPPRVLTLAAGDDAGEEIDVTVTAAEAGLYRLHFHFDYFVSGADRVQASPPIYLYQFP